MGRKQHYCGFCGKSDEEVDRLLSGPCIEVCNECIDLMHKLVHEPKPLLPVKLAEKPKKVISFRDAALKRRPRSCTSANAGRFGRRTSK
jgi:hypothetical protein